jgi:hypothetical protein
MYVHVVHALWEAMLWAHMSMFRILLTSSSNGSFLDCLPSTGRPVFDSRPGHVSPGTSSLGLR